MPLIVQGPQPIAWSFAIDGDPQFDDVPRPFTTRKPSSIAKLKAAKPSFVVIPGDMTAHGADGSKPWYKECSRDRVPNELGLFQREYMAPLEKAGIRVYCCIGNHDWSREYPDMQIPAFIRDRYGATYYSGDLEGSGSYSFDFNGVRFAILGLFPKDLIWFKALLSRTAFYNPMILIWHYNSDPHQPFSDWWTPEQRAAVFDLIQDRINDGKILCIINGHLHDSGASTYRGVNIVLASGDDKLGIVTMYGQKIMGIQHY